MRMLFYKDLFTTLVSALALVMAMTASVQATDKMANKPEEKSATKVAKVQDLGDETGEDERDYYTRRAKDILDKDLHANESKPHPLASNYPEHFVVVCTGGCRNRRAYIVDLEPRQTKDAVEIGEMIPTAAGGAPASQGENVVRCLGGCPTGRTIYAATGDVDGDGDWESSKVPDTSKDKGESGRWMTTINEDSKS